MEELGSDNDRVRGVEPPDFNHEPETVSQPMAQDRPDSYDPAFEGTVDFERSEGREAQQERRVIEDLDYQRRREDRVFEERAKQAPRHSSRTAEPFVREPRPHRTQQPINLMSEDDEAADLDYTHESSYTTRGGLPLSGSGYRRSRNDAARFKKDLKYGQYLEVPKGRRDLFASQRQMRNRRVALAVVLAVVVVVLIIVILNLAAH